MDQVKIWMFQKAEVNCIDSIWWEILPFLPFCATERSVFALQIVKPREFDDGFQLSDISVWQIDLS